MALTSKGATATASSYLDLGRLPIASINGDRKGLHWGSDPATGSGWHCATNGVYPDWLQVDFNGSKTINEINVITLQDNYGSPVDPTETMTFGTYGITAFDVQYWNGSSWVTVPNGSVTGNNKVWRKFTFRQITTSKIRVTVNNALAGYSRIVEVEAWSPTAGSTTADIKWLVADHLGTPRIIADKTGSLAGIKRHDYLSFGEELFAGTGGRTIAKGYSGDNVRQKFTQKERDNETGLDYFLARYYSSTQGRFTSPDEFTGGPEEMYFFVDDAAENPTFYAELDNPQSLNKYQYTYNNPLRYTDPTGHCVGVLRLICTPAGQRAIERGGQRVIERATPYVAGVVGVLASATEWARTGNTAGDASCPGCTSSQRMGQALMKGNAESRSQQRQQQSQQEGQSTNYQPNPKHDGKREMIDEE